MIDSERFAQVLRGFWLLAKLEEGGLSFFEKTYAGFLRSFFPALILAPLHAIHVASQYMTATPTPKFVCHHYCRNTCLHFDLHAVPVCHDVCGARDE